MPEKIPIEQHIKTLFEMMLELRDLYVETDSFLTRHTLSHTPHDAGSQTSEGLDAELILGLDGGSLLMERMEDSLALLCREAKRQEELRQEELRQEELRQEELRQEELRQEELRQEELYQEILRSNEERRQEELLFKYLPGDEELRREERTRQEELYQEILRREKELRREEELRREDERHKLSENAPEAVLRLRRERSRQEELYREEQAELLQEELENAPDEFLALFTDCREKVPEEDAFEPEWEVIHPHVVPESMVDVLCGILLKLVPNANCVRSWLRWLWRRQLLKGNGNCARLEPDYYY